MLAAAADLLYGVCEIGLAARGEGRGLVQLTYWEPASERTSPHDGDGELPRADVSGWRTLTPRGPTEIRHGYTLTKIDHLARLAVWRDRWARAMDIADRVEAAWYAIVEHLLTYDERPEPYDLVGIGMQATNELVRDHMRTHGRPTNDFWAGEEAMPNYQRYWLTTPTPSPEGRIVERMTLQQIMPSLSPRQREALLTLAATGDYDQAAAAMGIEKGTYRVTVSMARRRFFELWHEGETPSRQWRTDRRVRSRDGRDHLGRQRLTVFQVEGIRLRYQAGETLKAMAPEFGVSSVCLSRLLSGKSKPAPDRTVA